jgi:hypothetical protein
VQFFTKRLITIDIIVTYFEPPKFENNILKIIRLVPAVSLVAELHEDERGEDDADAPGDLGPIL